MYKGFKEKIYPNKEQQKLMFQFFGASRFAYNWVISVEEENYANGGDFLNKSQIQKLWKEKKKEFPWVKEMSGRAMRGGIYSALEAYDRFFKGVSSHPKFKSRKNSRMSCRTHECNTLIEKNKIKFEKIGWVRCRNNIPCSWSKTKAGSRSNVILNNPTISYDGVDFWFSVSLDVDDTKFEMNKEKTEPIGIDLGIKQLATDSVYVDCYKPNISKEKKKLKRLQRRANRYYLKRTEESKRTKTKLSKIPKTKNLIKLERKINKVYIRIKNKLDTNIHQYTTGLVKRNPQAIVIEDLNIKGMMKNKHLAEKVAEAKFYEVRKQLEYKCRNNGIDLIVADRWYASSKICSYCGCKKHKLSLSERTYVCKECGYTEDRDRNASFNLRNLAYNR